MHNTFFLLKIKQKKDELMSRKQQQKNTVYVPELKN